MRIMDIPNMPSAAPRRRHDGWTPHRRQLFLGFLAGRADVKRACASVGLSRQAAYKLRRRDPAFALAWDGALRSARRRAEEAFLAMLPEELRTTMSELSGERELRGAGKNPQDSVRSAASV
jgi:hypothetical protein